MGRATVDRPAPLAIDFPATAADGARSTSAFGRAVVTDALRDVDPAGALAAERDTNWRSGYVRHVRQLTVAGLTSASAAHTVATQGLASVHDRLCVTSPDAPDAPLDLLMTTPSARPVETIRVDGTAAPETELTLPYRGRRLRGDEVRRQLGRWVDGGIVEPTCAAAVDRVLAHPEWLRLPEHTVVVLGAGAEVGPLASLLRWGATVAAVDLPRPPIWQRVLEVARRGAGALLVPTATAGVGEWDGALAEHAGLDLLTEVPAIADWIGQLDGRLVIGNYAYADGGTHVRVSAAIDVLGQRVLAGRGDVALAFLATPTDAFAVPADAVAHSVRAYEDRSRTAKLVGRPLRTVSGGRLLRRAYAPGVDPGLCDALVPQQGPNYALAKRVQRWRATMAREAGIPVSLNVAPSTRTRSVVKNRALAAAFAGAHRFGIEVFDPATTNTLMAALLVHDLHVGDEVRQPHPWQDEAYAAAHGGLWRSPYAPRSALGLATLLGLGARRA